MTENLVVFSLHEDVVDFLNKKARKEKITREHLIIDILKKVSE